MLINETEPVNIFVPTGNFGNIFACYFLQKCGFGGVNKMFISNNANDVITQTHKTGKVQNKETVHTFAPAIDIAIPSNFERMLYLESNRDDAMISNIYKQLQGGKVQLDENLWSNFKKYFSASSIQSKVIIETQKYVMENYYGYKIDPHTAVAFAHLKEAKPDGRSIIISTAHPKKFVQMTSWENGEVKNFHTTKSADEEYLECKQDEVLQKVSDFFGCNLE